MRTLSLALTTTAAAVAMLAGASPAGAASSHHPVKIVGTPQLYAVQGTIERGRPSVYVVFRTEHRIGGYWRAFASMFDSNGRTMGLGRGPHCYKSFITLQDRKGDPDPAIRAGDRYEVALNGRASPRARNRAIASYSLVAKPLAVGAQIPACR